MGRVCVAWWNGYWTGRRKTEKEELGSNLKSTTNCVFMGKFLNALELDAVFCGYCVNSIVEW